MLSYTVVFALPLPTALSAFLNIKIILQLVPIDTGPTVMRNAFRFWQTSHAGLWVFDVARPFPYSSTLACVLSVYTTIVTNNHNHNERRAQLHRLPSTDQE